MKRIAVTILAVFAFTFFFFGVPAQNAGVFSTPQAEAKIGDRLKKAGKNFGGKIKNGFKKFGKKIKHGVK